MRPVQLLPVVLALACSNGTDTGSHRQPQPESTLSGTRPLRMRNCPSAVPGATTSAHPTSDGVDLRITARDPQARERILMLAQLQSGQGDPLAIIPAHSGLHGGPGTQGFCPIIHANTKVTFDELDEGVVVHVRAGSPDQVSQLQRATQARVHELAMPSS
jgi:hypothetical protein